MAPDRVGPHDEPAILVDGSADHFVADDAGDGQGLAGDHGFIDAGSAVDDDAVDRHAVAGADENPVIFFEGGDGDIFGFECGGFEI